MKNQTIARIRKNIWIYLPCVILTISLSMFYIYIQIPGYTAEVKIEQMGQSTENLLSIVNGTPATAEISAPAFIKEAMSGKNILVSCFITQDYSTQQSTYLFPYNIECTDHNKNLSEQSYQVKQTSENNYILTTSVAGIQRQKTGTFGEPVTDNNATIVITKKPRTPITSKPITGETTYSFTVTSPSYYAQQLSNDKSELDIDEQNRVITIEVTNPNPEIAKTTATALASRYITSPTNGTSGNLSSLEEKITASATKLSIMEEQIAEYKKQNQITELSYDTENSLSTLKDLQQQKTQLELNMAALNNISNHLRKNRETNNSLVEYGAISDAAFNDQITKLNSLYQQKENNTATASTEAEIESLKVLISERILSTRKRNAVQLDEINNEITRIQHKVSLIPEKASTLTALDRSYLIEKKVYDMLVEKRAQAIVSGEGISAKARILQEATVIPADRTLQHSMIIIAGLIAGMVTGFFLTLFISLFRTTSATVNKTVTDTNGVSVWADAKNKMLNRSGKELCTKILMEDNVKIISITSNAKGEGKTTFATTTGKQLASLDKKVLLIDMDPESKLEDIFDVTGNYTLTDVLTSATDVHDAIMITSIPNLEILSAGTLPEGINTLLASRKRNEIMLELRKYYDYIIIDCPSLSMGIEAVPLMKLSDLSLAVSTVINIENTSRMMKSMQENYTLSHIGLIINNITSVKKSNPGNFKHQESAENVENKPSEKQQIPGFMRKIAMWFY